MPKGGATAERTIKNFAGLNLRDAADKVQDNEWVSLQNVYQPSKGVFARRFGSVIDQSTIPYCSRISGIWRHTAQSENITLYHCVPNSTLLPDNTADLTLTDLNDGLGTIFDGGAVATVRVCYSWIGMGMEQTYNTRNRTGYLNTANLDAWNQTGHQSITLGGNTHSLRITVPAFPAGVVGANIFVNVGTTCEMTYIGTVSTSGGNLVFRNFIGPSAASADAFIGTVTPSAFNTSGTLKPGVYFISVAWLTGSTWLENPVAPGGAVPTMLRTAITSIRVNSNTSSISVALSLDASTNGAKNLYVFIGTQQQDVGQMSCVGIVGRSGTISITSIPNHNAQSTPISIAYSPIGPAFFNQCRSFIGANDVRLGFVMAKGSAGTLYNLFPSRGLFWYGTALPEPTTGNTTEGSLDYFIGAPRTQNDRYFGSSYVQPYPWPLTVVDPMFCYLLGVSYFVNGTDMPWMTDGYTMGQIVPVKAATQTILPPALKYIFTYQNGLAGVPTVGSNQMYGSNSNAPTNWATGGTGSLLRFVTVGDAFGGGMTAQGIFTPATEATNNPGSFLIGFKKNGTWMVASIPDPAASSVVGLVGGQVPSPMIQISGRVGCVSYRSVIQTPHGTMFLGQDSNVYLINRVAEPVRVGTKVQNLLSHLVGNDAAMRVVTAVYHDNHYKMSYPSAAAALASPIVNDLELWADLRTEGGTPINWFGPHAGRNIGAQIVLKGDNDNQSRLVADATLIRTYTADTTASLSDLDASNNPKAIAVSMTGKIFRFSEDAHYKRIFGALMDMYLDFSYTNNLLFEGFADEFYQSVNRQLSAGGATWDSSQWDQTNYADTLWEGFSFLFGQSNLIGRTFQMRLSSSDISPFLLASVTLYTKNERRRVVA